MKRSNLINKLEKEGFEVRYGYFSYWENVPYITRKDGSELFLTIYYSCSNNSATIGYDSKLITYDLVAEAIDNLCDHLLTIDENYKPFTNNKKIKKPWEN